MNLAHRQKPLDEDAKFQAELDALIACHEEWRSYFTMFSALGLRAQLTGPKLEFPAQKPELN
jgi:hypothetical protein